MEKALISAVIPMFNVERYIQGCIRSVIGGKYRNIEVICVDDGSTDGTVSAVRRMREADSRIRLIEQRNAGVSAARNTGLRASNGAYIAFIDADDWVSEDYLSTLYEIAAEKQADIVRCGFFSTGRYQPSGPFPADSVFEVREIPEKRRQDLIKPVWCALYRKEICPQFDEGVRIGEDTLYNLRIISSRKKLSAWVCDKRMYAYYCRPASLIRSSGVEEHYIAFNAIADRLDTLPVRKYAVICAVKQALAFRENIDAAGEKAQRPRAKALMKKALSLLLRCNEIPAYEKAMYIPFICSSKMYGMYRRSRYR